MEAVESSEEEQLRLYLQDVVKLSREASVHQKSQAMLEIPIVLILNLRHSNKDSAHSANAESMELFERRRDRPSE